MPIVDIIATLMVVGLTTIGIGIITVARRRQPKDPKAQGEQNLIKFLRDEASICGICQLPTTPSVDMFTNGEWFHLACFRSTYKEIQ